MKKKVLLVAMALMLLAGCTTAKQTPENMPTSTEMSTETSEKLPDKTIGTEKTTPQGDVEAEQTIQKFCDAYMAGNMETALSYTTLSEDYLGEPTPLNPNQPKETGITFHWEEEENPSFVFASYRFLAEGEEDSWTYLSMQAEKVDGVWKVTDAEFEK